ncbi:MAG: ankyrin repeat domain-containing protein [Deltaproteobacteria bacterium]|nr:ankyrin repeat domain-containing protein [Deltaproteobacteria bacterium]
MSGSVFHTGERLAIARKLYGYTQEDIIGEKGFPLVNVKTLRRWEKNGINTKRIEEVASFFGIELWAFIEESFTERQFKAIIANPSLQFNYFSSNREQLNKKEFSDKAIISLSKSRDISEKASVYQEIVQAAYHDDLELLKRIIDKTPGINHTDHNGWSILMNASYDNNIKLVRYLLELNANPNLSDEDGITALICAAGRGFSEISRLLIMSGTNINQPDIYGWTPLTWAAAFNDIKTLKLLALCKADCDFPDIHSWTPLMRSIKDHYDGVFQLLLRETEKLDYKNQYGESAAMLAVKYSEPGYLKSLIDNKADLGGCDINGRSILQIAKQLNNSQILKLL